MALTVETADQIVQVIQNDLMSCSRIEGPTLYGLLSKLHIAGHMRNLGLILGGMSTADETFVRVCCIGISESTALAITLGIKAGLIEDAKRSRQTYRVVHKFPHWGTFVSMSDGSEYVFDWFPTLDPGNPIISKFPNWLKDVGGVEYEDFEGFDEYTGW